MNNTNKHTKTLNDIPNNSKQMSEWFKQKFNLSLRTTIVLETWIDNLQKTKMSNMMVKDLMYDLVSELTNSESKKLVDKKFIEF